MRRLACLIALLLAVPPAEAALGALQVPFEPAARSNYSRTARPAAAIRMVVIHVTEGTFASTVAWFQNPHAHVSAHFVVSREGDVTQMVQTSHTAWHAGNQWVNLHSIGVEHEGFSGVDTTFTDAEYRASAELVASLLRRYVLPIDRRHVIGHNEVPDPSHPGLFGGFAHHTDPGRYWDWHRYLAYVRSYARGVTPAPLPLDVTIDGVDFGGTVRGAVPWSALPSGADVDHVDFLVDGRLRDSEHVAPYVYGGGAWDTTRETNTRHVLTARAVGRDGATASTSTVVSVKNPPIRIVSVNLVAGQIVSGQVRIEPLIRGTPVRVEFLLDGTVRDVEAAAPYAYGGATRAWDTTKEANGQHNLTVRAIGPGEKAAATRTTPVVVANP